MKRVVVAMSGGVDSSVAAALLKQQGYDVVALFMRNWDERAEPSHSTSEQQCSADRDYADVKHVCQQLDIPYYSVNLTQEYWDGVFEEFLDKYRQGLTPNPDVLCNKEIKFKALWKRALALGADSLATGHYCRVLKYEGVDALACGIDEDKDQSYFLHMIDPKVLKHVLFPLGGLKKEQVRQIAQTLGLATHAKKDSTGICFIGKRNFRDFLSGYLPAQTGKIKTLEGDNIGEHAGIAYYTIGQRKGLNIGGPGEAWFVVDKKIDTNELVVTQGDSSPQLFSLSCTTLSPHWLISQPKFPLRCSAKIRYRTPSSLCTLHCNQSSSKSDCLEVIFDTPQRAITPGQSIVFYSGEICLGGAIIESRSRENFT